MRREELGVVCVSSEAFVGVAEWGARGEVVWLKSSSESCVVSAWGGGDEQLRWRFLLLFFLRSSALVSFKFWIDRTALRRLLAAPTLAKPLPAGQSPSLFPLPPRTKGLSVVYLTVDGGQHWALFLFYGRGSDDMLLSRPRKPFV